MASFRKMANTGFLSGLAPAEKDNRRKKGWDLKVVGDILNIVEYFTPRPTWVYFDLGEVPVENLCAAFHIRSRDRHLHVKPSWSNQSAKEWCKAAIISTQKFILLKFYLGEQILLKTIAKWHSKRLTNICKTNVFHQKLHNCTITTSDSKC